MMDQDLTPIFEWCDVSNQVIIEHGGPRLILLAIHHNITGEYARHDGLAETAGKWVPMPIVKSLGTVDGDPGEFIDRARAGRGVEGYVVQFDSGHALKLKPNWHVEIHEMRDDFRFEKDLCAFLLTDGWDDRLGGVPDKIAGKALEYSKHFHGAIHDFSDLPHREVSLMKEAAKGDQKEFAAALGDNRTIPANPRHMAFQLKKEPTKENAVEIVKDWIRRSTGSARKMTPVKSILSLPDWNVGEIME